MKKEKKSYFYYIFGLLGICLNHAQVISGINISLSDVLLVIAFIYIVVKGIIIPRSETIYFFTLLLFGLLISIFYIPSKVAYLIPDQRDIWTASLKVLVLYLYFLVGYNSVRHAKNIVIIRGMSFAALLIAGIGAIGLIYINPIILNSSMYYSALRFKGMMNDPNYYSVMAVAALAYYLTSQKTINVKTWLILAVFSGAVIASGSKTGIITLIATIVLISIYSLLKVKNVKHVAVHMITLSIAIIFLLNVPSFVSVNDVTNKVTARYSTLLSDYSQAIAGGGSGRDVAWKTAISIIKMYPVTGTGPAAYTEIARRISNSGVLAHNTYLQITAEYGLPLALIFFIYLFVLLIRNEKGTGILSIDRKFHTISIMTVGFLVGSMGLSLENARMFWICIGILACYSKIGKRKEIKNQDT